jgi:hypothetical protein
MMLLYTPYIVTGGGGGNPELWVDPGADTASDYTTVTGWTVTGGAVEVRSPAAWTNWGSNSGSSRFANPVTDATATHELTLTIANFTSGGNCRINIDSYNGGGTILSFGADVDVNINGNGTFTVQQVPNASAVNLAFRIRPWLSTHSFNITDINVKEV